MCMGISSFTTLGSSAWSGSATLSAAAQDEASARQPASCTSIEKVSSTLIANLPPHVDSPSCAAVAAESGFRITGCSRASISSRI